MTKDHDEFRVKSGLPDEKRPQKTKFSFVGLFITVGIVFGFMILLFDSASADAALKLRSLGAGSVPEQALMNGVLALLVGSIQAWIFRTRIKTRIPLFIALAVLGGLAGGLVGGLLINAGVNQPWLIGAFNGGIAGAASSIAQNGIMGDNKYSGKWLSYGIISWLIIFAIGWTIGWQPENIMPLAIAGAFLVISSGVGLAIFLGLVPQIEFK